MDTLYIDDGEGPNYFDILRPSIGAGNLTLARAHRIWADEVGCTQSINMICTCGMIERQNLVAIIHAGHVRVSV